MSGSTCISSLSEVTRKLDRTEMKAAMSHHFEEGFQKSTDSV